MMYDAPIITGQIHNTIICKQIHFDLLSTLKNVINVKNKQNRTEDRPLCVMPLDTPTTSESLFCILTCWVLGRIQDRYGSIE